MLLPTRRGDRPAYRVTVRSVGPLGVAARQGSHAVPWRVRVLPPFTSRRHLPAKLERLRQLDGRSAAMIRGPGTEFDSLREYVVGDDVRSIDWRATARASDVMVRTWRPERDRRILLVLDTGRTSAARVGDAPRLDAAMDAALLLAALASRAGDRVDLLAYDRRIRGRVEGEAASSLLPALVQAMAPLEPALVETDYAGMVATVLARSARRSLVVLLSALDPAPVEEGLLPVLAPLVRRHTVVLASVGDPRVGQLAAGRGDAESVYGAAAAARAGLDRRRVAELLERRGVEVVDAPPDELPPLLVGPLPRPQGRRPPLTALARCGSAGSGGRGQRVGRPGALDVAERAGLRRPPAQHEDVGEERDPHRRPDPDPGPGRAAGRASRTPR